MHKLSDSAVYASQTKTEGCFCNRSLKCFHFLFLFVATHSKPNGMKQNQRRSFMYLFVLCSFCKRISLAYVVLPSSILSF